MNKRRVGLGFTGLGDALIMLRLRYDTREARQMAAKISEAMRDHAYRASAELAREKGAFPLFNADLYLSGSSFAARLPDDMKQLIRRQGIRNSHLLSIAPTGTISLSFADNASNAIEPPFSLAYTRNKRTPDGGTQAFAVVDHGLRVFLGTLEPAFRYSLRRKLQDQEHPYFYSALRKALENAPKEVYTGNEWLTLLTPKTGNAANHLANKYGVKQEELDWTGIRTSLGNLSDSEVSRTALLDLIDSNAPIAVFIGGWDEIGSTIEWAGYREMVLAPNSRWTTPGLRRYGMRQIMSDYAGGMKGGVHLGHFADLANNVGWYRFGEFIPTSGPLKGKRVLFIDDIQAGDDLGGVRRLASFTEKPSREVALEYIADGSFLWNSGMFFWRTSSLEAAMKQH